ncbi:MAG: hypothetical protein CVV51_10195 [Spirochaetae bacterium HGW-Spirochaetae-7]|nr:MAG: hypothetical protein CVV51_10195 [Spirochaetae bacterium HGW-Spirochaetae-7]
MDAHGFDEALDFAISMERAAVAFYAQLSAMASFAAQKSVLAEFLAMEEGHVTMLTGMKTRGAVKLSPKAAVDLGLARRLAAEEKPTAGMNFQDILSTAIKKEERSGSLYVDMAAASADTEARSIFERLAAEETRHKRYFEELYETEISRDN